MPKKSGIVRQPRPEVLAALRVRRSGIHGKGVYTTELIRKGTRIVEYAGVLIPARESKQLPLHDQKNQFYTLYYVLENGDTIDAGRRGNAARWINHSCAPNCATEEENGRIFIYALTTIYPGEELFFDYALQVAGRRTATLKESYRCICGSPNCRGSMLRPR